MKSKIVLLAASLTVFTFIAKAQSNVPEGYNTGSVTLANGNTYKGFIKEKIKKDASVSFIDEATKTKTAYTGSQLNATTIANDNFICINGDFFKIITAGKISFLQKQSDVAGKIIYNGADPIVLTGSTGSIGSYYSYINNSLNIINKKTVNDFITKELVGNSLAIEKAKAINGDIAKLQEAVEIYNNTK
jgi:hypothetical protein